ncbi:hypothetical protein SBRY_30829 [Actinacidiphila bryophytorum]|uniref:Uncharacterized protein n=1 Tax=Actinacidiphila bryophytorum TaxID=1436133 RepID=A0A9W4MFS4_9ACTN|nr:hypothetical protein SBRY_30829 [Actinacidiphila bryophytorum]
MSAPNTAANVCRGTLSQSAREPYSLVVQALTGIEHHRANHARERNRRGRPAPVHQVRAMWPHRVHRAPSARPLQSSA